MQLLENYSVQDFPFFTGVYTANLRTNTIMCTLYMRIIPMCFHVLDRHSIGFMAYLNLVIGMYIKTLID